MDITGYLNEIRALAASGRAIEHSYRYNHQKIKWLDVVPKMFQHWE
jgi:hypothetical protein